MPRSATIATVSPRPPRLGTSKEIAVRRAVMARDAGLARISAVTRWLAVGVVGLSGALALIASQAFHGHTVSSTSSTSPGAVSQTPSVAGDGVSSGSVTPTQSAPVVVSGGS